MEIRGLKTKLNLYAVEPVAQPSAIAAFERGDAQRFVDCAYSMGGTLAVVADNAEALKERGIFEAALVHGYVGCKTNHRDWTIKEIESLFRMADREKLRTVGAPLPGTGPFTVYRGVGRSSRQRQVSGMSWTSSLDVACHFALAGDHDPAVYQATVQADAVYCYFVERGEDEFICRPNKHQRLPLSLSDLEKRAERVTEKMEQAKKQRLAKVLDRKDET
jgi:hypothetical protein